MKKGTLLMFSEKRVKTRIEFAKPKTAVNMNEDLSLFSAVNEDNVEQELTDQQLQQSMSELIANRSSALQKYAHETAAVMPEQHHEDPVQEPVTYTKEEIFQDVARYFGGDELAAGVWIDKYALKNADGQLVERTPEDMHRRMAREFARIERRYANPMSEEQIFNLFDHFKYVIPQGSPMAGIGNKYQVVSLSNCFVIGNSGSADSYGGIMKMDEEQVQLMKRRGGVGHDMSDIRPSGSHADLHRHRSLHGTLLQLHPRGGAGRPQRRPHALHLHQTS